MQRASRRSPRTARRRAGRCRGRARPRGSGPGRRPARGALGRIRAGGRRDHEEQDVGDQRDPEQLHHERGQAAGDEAQHQRPARGSKASRSPSPSRFTARITDDSARPGRSASQGWVQVVAAVDAVGDHLAPARGRRRHAEAEVREPGLEQHVGGDERRGVDDQRRRQVRQDVAGDDPPLARADRARGLDEQRRAQREHRRPHQPRRVVPREQRDHHDHVAEAGADHHRRADGQEQRREGHRPLDRPADHGVRPAPGPARGHAEHQPDEHRQQGRGERRPRARPGRRTAAARGRRGRAGRRRG